MNNKAILGISLGAVFAISMIMAPAYAGVLEGTPLEALLKDHAAGKNPAKNPPHYELQTTFAGNYTQFAVDKVAAGAAAVGHGFVNGTGYVYAVTLHDFDDCIANPEFCGDYTPHGHEGQLVATTANCTAIGADLELDGNTVLDFGEVKVKVKGAVTEVELDDIPTDAALNLNKDVCNDDEIDYVDDIVLFNITAGSGGEFCVFVEGTVNADGKNGPDNKNRDGGFRDDNHPELCPVVP